MVEILVVILVIQFAWGFYFLFLLDKGLCGHDVRLFFLAVFALYSLFYPLISVIFSFSVLKDPAFLNVLVCYNMAIAAFNWVILVKKRPIRKLTVKYSYSINFIPIVCIFAALLVFSIAFMVLRGVPVFKFGEGMMSREEYGENVNQLWVVLAFIISGISCFLIYYWNALSAKQKKILLLLLLIYVIYQISLGNRNEFSVLVFFSLGFYLIKRRKNLNIRIIIGLGVLFIFSFYITVFRDPNVRDLARSEAVEILIQSNEFVYPIQTLFYTITDNWDFRFGYTYLILPFEIMLPRALYPDKPMTLGGEFVDKTFGPGYMGFAYTPVTEAYLNFGYIGPFLVFLLYSLFLDRLVKESNSKGVNYKYLMVYALSFNINRGEFASLIYQSIFIFIAYKIALSLCKRLAKEKEQIQGAE